MKPLRPLVAAAGAGCLFIGMPAAPSGGGGTTQEVMEFGRTLIAAGAVLIAGAVVDSAVAGQRK